MRPVALASVLKSPQLSRPRGLERAHLWTGALWQEISLGHLQFGR